jgi:acyl-CoA thioester hydrolase
MTSTVAYRGVVYPWQCDQMGHMNVMWYVGKFDEATWYFASTIGLTPTYMSQTQRGMAGVQQNITYKRELFAGAVVEIRSRIVSIADRKIVIAHEMRDVERDEVCATCELTAVHIDRSSRRAIPFPPAVRTRAESLLSSWALRLATLAQGKPRRVAP